MANETLWNSQSWDWNNMNTAASNANAPKPAAQVTDVYNTMKGFLKGTHWSKPYYSALIHNNPELPYHLLEHVNCTYLSTPGRAPTLLALKQHAQSLAVLISHLAPAQVGGTFEPSAERTINRDAFAAEEAFDWLNDLQQHYNTDDGAHKKPLNALVNLVKSNSDTTGPKWHCPLEKVDIEFPEKHPFQQYRPYETHLTLLMHANEILERLDHEYSAMGGILGIIPLDSEKVDEGRALQQAKTTLVGQWLIHTQHLTVRMHELEIAYGNSLDLLANEAIVPMQHISNHGPDGRSGREIIFPQDRWIMANAGEDVFTFIHQMLDRAEAHQDAQDRVFAQQGVLGDAAYTNNEQETYRGIVKADLNTRFYRLRKSGHGPLFVLPAFGDRAGTKHTRDMENRPTVITIPQPTTKGVVNAWEAKNKDVDLEVLQLKVTKSNLEARIEQLKSSVGLRERELERANALQKEIAAKVSDEDRNLAEQLVYHKEKIEALQNRVRQSEERERVLTQEVENFKKANVGAQHDDSTNTLVDKVNEQEKTIGDLRRTIEERDKEVQRVSRDADTLRIMNNPSFSGSTPAGNPEQVRQLKASLAAKQQQNQFLQEENHNLKKSKNVKGRILNFPEDFRFDYGSTFEDTNQGITACSTTYFKALLAVEQERNNFQQTIDSGTLNIHTLTAKLDKYKARCERLRVDNEALKGDKDATNGQGSIINLPWTLGYTSSFRDDNQGLIVLNTAYYDQLVAQEKIIDETQATDAGLEGQSSQALQQQLMEARSQLRQSVQYQNNSDAQHSELQTQVKELSTQLQSVQKNRKRLEDQLNTLLRGKPESDLNVKIHQLEKQVESDTQARQTMQSELEELKKRYKKAQDSEVMLRGEMRFQRQQMRRGT
ncbi:hypothetical protein F4808DRAFT_469424 [Astrocystis sublimbata]|nr:hypothetical protein F4808DRAFT_469424 [Astrocystis sublimbata]